MLLNIYDSTLLVYFDLILTCLGVQRTMTSLEGAALPRPLDKESSKERNSALVDNLSNEIETKSYIM